MGKYDDCDYSGWATVNDLVCSDGRILRRDAFKVNDGQKVPLVWNHIHNDAFNVLGHAMLENKPKGVYAYLYLNDTEQGRNAKTIIEHGDVGALSIYANQLKQRGSEVLHGVIREVSLVIAGANPEAFIDQYSFSHSEDDEDGDSAVIYTGEPLEMYHADSSDEEEEDKKMAEDTKKKTSDEGEETVEDVFNTLSEKQKTVVYALIGSALEGQKRDDDDDDEEGDSDMKHNVFENYEMGYERNVLSHADQEAIIELAKRNQVGSLQTAMEIYAEDNALQHDAIAGGFVQTGEGNVTELFPEYKDVYPGAPEVINYDQGWVNTVLNKVHKSPISRIRTRQVDIRNIDSLRGKGYQKGKQKNLSGNFNLVRRTTDPQTIYVRNALHRDDIVDITDFDYVKYLYDIDRSMLNEELATAIMLGDGREEGDPNKIDPEHIRPIWTDDSLYAIHATLDYSAAEAELNGANTGDNFGQNYIYAEAFVNCLLYARENYKGSGQPDLYIHPHMLNVMLLARDLNGRRIYSSKAELASTLNVGNIYTVEQFENKTRTVSGQTKKLLAIVCNLNDYALGATKGGEVTHFTQFDIDFNQEKSLIETRCSGALTRVYSAIVIEEPVTTSGNEEP